MKKIALSLVMLASLPASAQAVANTYARCHNNAAFSKDSRAKPEDAPLLKLALSPNRPCNLPIVQQYALAHRPVFTDAQLQQMAQSLLTYVQQTRQDTQVGASDSSTGTTSLVSKGVGALVGVALESGSIDRTTSGNVTSVTVNTAEAAKFLSAGNFVPCPLIDATCSFGRKLLTGLTVVTTYDVSQANTSTNSSPAQTALSSLVGSNNPAFTGVSARLDLHTRKKNLQRDAVAAAYQASSYLTATAAYASAYNSLVSSVDNDDSYKTALTQAVEDLQDTTTNDTDAKVDAILSNMEITVANIINNNPVITTEMQTYASAENAYYGARDAALGAILNKTTFSFEYDYNRLANQPDQSDFKSIYSYRSDAANDRILQITGNAGATIYDNLIGSSTSRLRCAQAAFQLDYTATSAASKVQAAVSGGYYFQYMSADGLLTLPSTALAPGTSIPLPGNASQLLNTTGPIHIGQGKITLSIKGTNISIPLALTFSNRTDLIKATRVGGNFGITYDFSSLFSTLKN
jgi:hypothetical protein